MPQPRARPASASRPHYWARSSSGAAGPGRSAARLTDCRLLRLRLEDVGLPRSRNEVGSARELLAASGHRKTRAAASGRVACGYGRASLPGGALPRSLKKPRGERSQETDGREAGTSAVRSSGTIVPMAPPDFETSSRARHFRAAHLHRCTGRIGWQPGGARKRADERPGCLYSLSTRAPERSMPNVFPLGSSHARTLRFHTAIWEGAWSPRGGINDFRCGSLRNNRRHCCAPKWPKEDAVGDGGRQLPRPKDHSVRIAQCALAVGAERWRFCGAPRRRDRRALAARPQPRAPSCSTAPSIMLRDGTLRGRHVHRHVPAHRLQELSSTGASAAMRTRSVRDGFGCRRDPLARKATCCWGARRAAMSTRASPIRPAASSMRATCTRARSTSRRASRASSPRRPGSSPADLVRAPGYLLTRAGPLVSIAIEWRSPLAAEALRARILAHVRAPARARARRRRDRALGRRDRRAHDAALREAMLRLFLTA